WAWGIVAGVASALAVGASMIGAGGPGEGTAFGEQAAGAAGGRFDGTGSLSPARSTTPVRYGRDIRPLLADHCFKCHGPDAGARRAELRLDQAESATAAHDGGTPIVPGRPEDSELLTRIASTEPDEMMPPPTSGKQPLTAEERQLIRAWIAGGAAY